MVGKYGSDYSTKLRGLRGLKSCVGHVAIWRGLAWTGLSPIFSVGLKCAYVNVSYVNVAYVGQNVHSPTWLKVFLLATENPLKMMKNAFYFTLKALFILNIFKCLSWLFGHVEKRLDQKDQVIFKIHDATILSTIAIQLWPYCEVKTIRWLNLVS